MKRLTCGVDLDGVLCEGKHWRSAVSVLKAKPIKEGIDMVNKYYKDYFIVIYTARQNYLMSNTLEWLNKNNVHYHAISNQKINFDYIIDDVGEPK